MNSAVPIAPEIAPVTNRLRRIARASDSRPSRVPTISPATGETNMKAPRAAGLACTSLVRNSPMNGIVSDIAVPTNKLTDARGSRDRRRSGAWVTLTAVTRSSLPVWRRLVQTF